MTFYQGGQALLNICILAFLGSISDCLIELEYFSGACGAQAVYLDAVPATWMWVESETRMLPWWQSTSRSAGLCSKVQREPQREGKLASLLLLPFPHVGGREGTGGEMGL